MSFIETKKILIFIYLEMFMCIFNKKKHNYPIRRYRITQTKWNTYEIEIEKWKSDTILVTNCVQQ